MIIDTHVHIGRGERLSDTYQVNCSTEMIISTMDEAGVDQSCIMPVAYEDYEPGIQEVYEAVAAHPDRLIGYARVNLHNQEHAFEQLRRCFEQYNFRGVKIHHGLGDGFPTRPLMELLSEYGRPLLLHGSPQAEFVDSVRNLARSYPKVPVICGHMGGFNASWPGFVKLYAVEAKQTPNLYLDTAFVFLHQWIGMAVEICGPEKVVFGSDGPVLHPAIVLKQIELCHFSDSERQMDLHERRREFQSQCTLVPFATTAQSKRQLIDALAVAFERDLIRILPDEELIKAGSITFAAPEGGWDDRVMSCGLAWTEISARLTNKPKIFTSAIHNLAPEYEELGEGYGDRRGRATWDPETNDPFYNLMKDKRPGRRAKMAW